MSISKEVEGVESGFTDPAYGRQAGKGVEPNSQLGNSQNLSSLATPRGSKDQDKWVSYTGSAVKGFAERIPFFGGIGKQVSTSADNIATEARVVRGQRQVEDSTGAQAAVYITTQEMNKERTAFGGIPIVTALPPEIMERARLEVLQEKQKLLAVADLVEVGGAVVKEVIGGKKK